LAWQLFGVKPVNLDFLMTLPEAKRVPFLSLLTPIDFEE
jgi:hypothetical protein